MAFIVVMPIPFGNVLSALALMLIGLGLVIAGLAMFITAGLMLMAWTWSSEWLVGWFSM